MRRGSENVKIAKQEAQHEIGEQITELSGYKIGVSISL
jgi:hypothetical protein